MFRKAFSGFLKSNFMRNFTSRTSSCSQHLKSRGLIKLAGSDSASFLQGLLTNDVIAFKHAQNQNSMYAFLLNSKGRIFCDLIVYKLTDDSFLIECDEALQQDFKKNVSRYKIRKKVEITQTEDYRVWTVFPNSLQSENQLENVETCNGLITQSPDPRLPSFCSRLILESSSKREKKQNVKRFLKLIYLQFILYFSIHYSFV